MAQKPTIAVLDVTSPLPFYNCKVLNYNSTLDIPRRPSPCLLQNSLRRQSLPVAVLRSDRSSTRPQRSRRRRALLRAGASLSRGCKETLVHPRGARDAAGGTVIGIPRPRARGADATSGTAHLQTVRDCAELRVCVQGGAE
jgi:hypothetical protein